MGAFLGSLADLPAPQLGAVAIRAALERAKLAARRRRRSLHGQRALGGHWPSARAPGFASSPGIPNTRTDDRRQQGLRIGLQAVVLGAKTVALGDADIVVAGGMESMSNVPYYLPKARSGYRMGDGAIIDGMVFDGLLDPYHQLSHGRSRRALRQGVRYSREAQDAFAHESYRRALAAQKAGSFEDEIVPVEIAGKKGEKTVVSRRRRAQALPAREDGSAQARVRERRHHHRRQRVEDQRWRGRGRARERARREAARARRRWRASSATAAQRRPRSGSRPRLRSRSSRTLSQPRPRRERHRSLRDQRGVRGGHHGVHHAVRPRSEPASTCAAAQWRSGIPSARAARAS